MSMSGRCRSIPRRPRDAVTDQQSPDERRAHARTDIELPVRVTSGGDVIDARTVNVSEGGC